jgi:hypothetical protein
MPLFFIELLTTKKCVLAPVPVSELTFALFHGSFAVALRDQRVWVMNIVPIDSPDTLPIIYDRVLFGMYHDWCESFITYPRTYDLLHTDHLFSKLKKWLVFRVPILNVLQFLHGLPISYIEL